MSDTDAWVVRGWWGLCLAGVVVWVLWLPSVPLWWLWLLVGYALADAGSYLFHYIIDHYGDPRRPGLVREFQRHHLEPWGISRKSVSQAIVPAARVATPVMLVWLVLGLLGWVPPTLLLLGCELGVLWVFTQVFHRWAHMPTRGVVRLAQRAGLIMGSRAHRHHHCPPFHSHFAVINGWSNRLLDRLQAPRLVDTVLGRFGCRKRGLEASLKVIKKQTLARAGTLTRDARSYPADA